MNRVVRAVSGPTSNALKGLGRTMVAQKSGSCACKGSFRTYVAERATCLGESVARAPEEADALIKIVKDGDLTVRHVGEVMWTGVLIVGAFILGQSVIRGSPFGYEGEETE